MILHIKMNNLYELIIQTDVLLYLVVYFIIFPKLVHVCKKYTQTIIFMLLMNVTKSDLNLPLLLLTD